MASKHQKQWPARVFARQIVTRMVLQLPQMPQQSRHDLPGCQHNIRMERFMPVSKCLLLLAIRKGPACTVMSCTSLPRTQDRLEQGAKRLSNGAARL